MYDQSRHTPYWIEALTGFGDKTSRHLAEVDGLRAVAVLAVIAFHYKKAALHYGYLGVDVFFVISGFVITRSILEDVERGKFSLNAFFMRRFKRLFPSLAVLVIATMIVGAMLMPVKVLLVTAISALAGAANLALWFYGHDYFAITAELNPLTHTWSLGVEEQFYLIFPLVLLAARRLRWSLMFVCSALFLASVLSSFWARSPTDAFYLPIFRFWELLSGVLVALRRQHAKTTVADASIPRSALQTTLVILLVAVLATSALTERQATFAAVGLATAIIYVATWPGATSIILCALPMQTVGRISYSLYLWHWPIAVYSKLTVPESAILPTYLALTAILATASFLLIEHPLRKRTWSTFRQRVVPTYVTFTTATAATVFAVWMARNILFLGPPALLEASFLKLDPCHIPGKGGLEKCLKPALEGKQTVWLIGDSHAGNLKPALDLVTSRMQISFQHLTGRSLVASLGNACSPFLCPEGTAQDFAARLRAVGRQGDVILISFAQDRFFDGGLNVRTFATAFDGFVADLIAAKFRVVLVEDIPKVCTDDFYYWRSLHDPASCTVSREASLAARAPLSSIYAAMTTRHGAEVVDFHDEFCGAAADAQVVCSNWRDGELVFIDASPHMTMSAAETLAPRFAEVLVKHASQSTTGR